MIQAYVDESGGKGQGPVLVFSTMISDALRWSEFSDEWQACLDEHPQIKYFKMRKAVSLNEQFRRFSSLERDTKIRKLAQIIRRHVMTEQFCILDLHAFSQTLETTGKPLGYPYFIPFQTVILSVCYELSKRGHTDQCEIFFDEHVIFGPTAKSWYPVLRAMVSDPNVLAIMPVEPLFRSDSNTLPLQAVDMTAWMRRRTVSGEQNQFEWLWSELEGIVNVSEYSGILDSDLLRDAMTGPRRTPEEVQMAARAMEAYLDTFGGDPVEAIIFFMQTFGSPQHKP